MPDDNHISWANFEQTRSQMAGEQVALARQIAEIDRRTSIHEAVCAERYKGLDKKLNGLIVLSGILLISVLFGATPAIQMGIRTLGLTGVLTSTSTNTTTSSEILKSKQ